MKTNMTELDNHEYIYIERDQHTTCTYFSI